MCGISVIFSLLMSVQQPQEHQSYFRAFGLYYLAHNSSIIDNKRSSLTCTVQLSRLNIFLDKKSIKIEKLPLALKCWYFTNPFQLGSPPESNESSHWFYSNIILHRKASWDLVMWWIYWQVVNNLFLVVARVTHSLCLDLKVKESDEVNSSLSLLCLSVENLDNPD